MQRRAKMTTYATVQDVTRSIMFSGMSNDDLSNIMQALKYARAQLGREKIRSFRMGDKVKFISSKTGVVMVGTVSKVAIKYVTVTTQRGAWKVPANMLESA